jgi:hypothetical protein
VSTAHECASPSATEAHVCAAPPTISGAAEKPAPPSALPTPSLPCALSPQQYREPLVARPHAWFAPAARDA